MSNADRLLGLIALAFWALWSWLMMRRTSRLEMALAIVATRTGTDAEVLDLYRKPTDPETARAGWIGVCLLVIAVAVVLVEAVS